MNSISANLNIMIKTCEKVSKILIRDFGEIEKLQVSKKAQKILLQILTLKLKKLLLKNLKKLDQIILS